MSNSTQSALREDGTLKDASEIQWFNDADDVAPISASPTPNLAVPIASNPSTTQPAQGEANTTNNVNSGRHSSRTKNLAKFQASLVAEHEDEFGEVIKPVRPRPRRIKATGGSTQVNQTAGESDDEDDDDFPDLVDVSDSENEEDDTLEKEIDHDELANLLSSKTIPSGSTKIASRMRIASIKRKQANVSAQNNDIEAPSAKRSCADDATASSEPEVDTSAKPQNSRRNPIYHFYEAVLVNAEGKRGEPGDKHFKCYHGARKTFTITLKMRMSLNSLIGHLKTHFPAMHRLYLVLKSRGTPPTEEEIAIAQGRKTLDPETAAKYVANLEEATSNIIAAFHKQAQKAQGEWDQAHFEDLLGKWIVACDQPFEEVDRPEFRELLTYTHHPAAEPLHIPHHTAIRSCIMKMGEDTVGGLKNMFAELTSKVSLSLDAWTSSNGYAFLAIVAHYWTNDDCIEEILIEFRELIGQHSGENMAEAVWETIKLYGLEKKGYKTVQERVYLAEYALSNAEYTRVLYENL